MFFYFSTQGKSVDAREHHIQQEQCRDLLLSFSHDSDCCAKATNQKARRAEMHLNQFRNIFIVLNDEDAQWRGWNHLTPIIMHEILASLGNSLEIIQSAMEP